MGTFMDSSKRVVVKNINASHILELGVSTTLAFYIVERNQDTPLTEISYQVEKIAGRATTILTPWITLDITGITDSIYSFEYLLSGVTVADNILMKFKVVDGDGLESFIALNNFKVV
jgi:hypothetical protein